MNNGLQRSEDSHKSRDFDIDFRVRLMVLIFLDLKNVAACLILIKKSTWWADDGSLHSPIRRSLARQPS